eukprot:TRINITY_DN70935_c0_g1_i1.p1 TRINITY_DN70935_c0_g1~~TRINITY_DN70935_c0_g1_i1.p1  ORF type:complete len:329 (-),score=28.42 TRINITY_DN70935_c0_g1_i1:55-1041(-)
MWIICDALGIGLSVATWALLAFTDWVIIRFVLVAWFWTERPRFEVVPLTDFGTFLLVVYQIPLFLSWFSHVRAATTDPGTISVSSAPANFPDPVSCTICEERLRKACWKPPRAHHCRTCKVCIFRMDHHCPWINNCVGYGNQKLFMLFLGYTAISALLTLGFLIASVVYWLWSQKSWSEAAPPGSVSLICSGIVAVECLAAVLFVGDFLQEQIESIQMNSTLIETYKRTHGRRTDFWDHFKGIFGVRWWEWPLPYPSAPPPDFLEEAIPDGDSDFSYDDSHSHGDDINSLGIAGKDSEGSHAGTPSQASGRPRQRNRSESAHQADDED